MKIQKNISVYVILLVLLQSCTLFAYDVDVNDFGVAGDGVTDDGPEIQNAINDVYDNGGGNVFLRGDQKYYIASLVEVKANVAIVGEHENIGSSNISAWDNLGSAFVIKSDKYVRMRSDSSVKGVLFIRENQALPEEDADTNFTGKAIRIEDGNCVISHCAIIGFYNGIETLTTDTPNITIENCNIDCLNGIKITNSSTGTKITNCHAFPFISSVYEDKYRNGTGYIFVDVNNGSFEYNFTHGHKLKGFLLIDSNNNIFRGCGADNLRSETLTPLGNGYEIRGNSDGNQFLACQAASHETGFHIDVSADDLVTIKGGAIFKIKNYGIYVKSGDVGIYNQQIVGHTSHSTDGVDMNNSNSLVRIYSCAFVDLVNGIDNNAGTLQEGYNLTNNVTQYSN